MSGGKAFSSSDWDHSFKQILQRTQKNIDKVHQRYGQGGSNSIGTQLFSDNTELLTKQPDLVDFDRVSVATGRVPLE